MNTHQDTQQKIQKNMPENTQQDIPQNNQPDIPQNSSSGKPEKKHRWISIPLKIIGILIGILILIPVLLYIPPIQSLVKDLACSIVSKSTGMKLEIGRFSLKFPLDLQLDDVVMIPAPGDTMVAAAQVIADVKLLPLLKLDVQLNQLELQKARLNILSADSSMNMKIRAGLLRVAGGSQADIRTGHINLRDAYLRNGDLSLYMNVWKKQNTPADSTATQFIITANSLKVDNFGFGMSMLPTIDTLTLKTKTLEILDANINLATNNIHASSLTGETGDFIYLTPTTEYIASHPAPVDTTQTSSPPMVIAGDKVSLNNFNLLYAVKGAVPQPGFDPSYISLSKLSVGVKNFINAGTSISAPVTRLEGSERSGLTITSGSGVFSMDSTGMALKDLQVKTPFSRLDVSALIPNALLALQPSAVVDVNADVSLGMADINAFMPSLKEYTSAFTSVPLDAKLRANGELGNVAVPQFDLNLPGILSLQASGKAQNPLDFKKLIAELNFNGKLSRPSVIEKIAGPLGFNIPALTLKGKATANAQTYGADFTMTSADGNIAGRGNVGLTSERYQASLSVKDLNVAAFMKELGIGTVSATLQANGAGFNPEKRGAHTDIDLKVDKIVYNHTPLQNIQAQIGLHNGVYSLNLNSRNSALNGHIVGSGTIDPDLYTFDVDLDVKHIDLLALGLSTTPGSGATFAHVKGKASPSRWNYDAVMDIDSINWNLSDADYIIPAMAVTFRSDNVSTIADIESKGIALNFESPRNLKVLLDSITVATAGLDKQIASKQIDVGGLQSKLPPFRLAANGSGEGSGLIASILKPSGMSIDTLYGVIGKDSLVNGNITVAGLNTGSMLIDSLNLRLQQRRQLLDYFVTMKNGPGPMSEFADVSLQGYLGNSRMGAYLVQHNIKGEQGYRIGFTAGITDSIATVHFTPLKATIAYLPWNFNLDNFVSYKFADHTIQADLQASSAESSILLKTEDAADGEGTDLHMNLKQIKIQDFLNMSVSAPPLTATVNSDLRLHYTGKILEGKGTLGLTDLSYDRVKLQDLQMLLNAGLDPKGDSRVEASLNAGGEKALTATALLSNDSVAGGLALSELVLLLDGLPLDLANPFIGVETASLSGKLKGKCDVKFDKNLLLNGALSFESAGVYIPMIGTRLRIAPDSIRVTDNIVNFSDFKIWGVNSNPLAINGLVNAQKFTDIKLDLNAAANNFQLVGTQGDAKSDISGKLFLNLTSGIKGSLSVMDVQANLSVLSNTDVVYSMSDLAAQLDANSAEGLVKFVNLRDTTAVAKVDSLASSPMAMRISANLTLQPGMQVTVNNLNGSQSNKVEVNPSGSLAYFQNYMGDMKLNGQLLTGNGQVSYTIPVVMMTKNFSFNPESSITWTGDVMNPRLNISAVDAIKANVSTSGLASLVDFNIGLNITGTLSAPQILFDLSTDNDMTIENELQGMTPEQRSTTAMNLLITGQYTGTGARNVNNNMLTGGLYGALTATLNQLAAKAIKGVDLSFGVNQYQTGDVENTTTNTSYSYQVSKSLFDNRFKIVVGGNYSTDASADENFSENLISDVSFEYILKRTNNYNIITRLFRHTGFESILEGEITETGLGIAYRRRLNSLKSFFRFRRRHKNSDQRNETIPQDTVKNTDRIESENTDTVYTLPAVKK